MQLLSIKKCRPIITSKEKPLIKLTNQRVNIQNKLKERPMPKSPWRIANSSNEQIIPNKELSLNGSVAERKFWAPPAVLGFPPSSSLVFAIWSSFQVFCHALVHWKLRK